MSVDPFSGRSEITAEEYNDWLSSGQPAAVVLPPIAEPDWLTNEKAFLQKVTDYATAHSWRSYHTHKSANSAPGFSDLVMCRAPRLIFAELKTETGRVMPDQQRWLDELSKVSSVEVYLWRPSDWPDIERILK